MIGVWKKRREGENEERMEGREGGREGGRDVPRRGHGDGESVHDILHSLPAQLGIDAGLQQLIASKRLDTIEPFLREVGHGADLRDGREGGREGWVGEQGKGLDAVEAFFEEVGHGADLEGGEGGRKGGTEDEN